MLSDDITAGIRSTLNGLGRFASSALRGAILFGAIALAGFFAFTVVLPFLVPSVMAASSLGPTISAVWCAGPIPMTMWGAMAGAALLGVTSLIPGKAEGWGVSKMATAAAEAPVKVVAKTLEPQRAPQMENPYFEEGKGTKNAATGDVKAPVMAKC